MNSSKTGVLLGLMFASVLGLTGCEDNEASSGIGQNTGKASGKTMTPEEYAKQNAGGAAPKGYSKQDGSTKGTPAAPK